VSADIRPLEHDIASATIAGGEQVHLLTVGTSARLIRNLWDRIAARAGVRMTHLVHPSYDRAEWDPTVTMSQVLFVRDDLRTPMPEPDVALLESLVRDDVPTIHNMIMADRVVRQLDYREALAYATLLARRFLELFADLRPAAVIGDFDALHSSLSLAVARHLGIPWFALSFSALPPGLVACCANLSPASTVVLEPQRRQSLATRALEVLCDFEHGRARAPAYLPPKLLAPMVVLRQLPAQLGALLKVARRRRLARYRRFSDYRNSYTMTGLFREAYRLRRNLWQLRGCRLIERPPDGHYAFFGLHMQPEASIDTYAHFFANQTRVIELMSRSLPPTHRLLVKLHKSDTTNYSRAYVASLARYPGVEVVSPHANALEFIRNAQLVFAIQGTIGLEAALFGKPVIMFGDSPVKVFPSVSTFGRTIDLPRLVRAKLAEPPPGRAAILEALTAYLAPRYPASDSDWGVRPSDAEIEDYARFFRLLVRRLDATTAHLRSSAG
jgi:hypothetical protein